MTEIIINWVIGGGLISMIALFIKNNKDFNDKIMNAYKRFDQHKDSIKNEFVEVKMCDLQHKFSNQNFERLEKVVRDGFTEIKKEIRNGRGEK